MSPFDRSKQPAAGPSPLVKVPEFWKSEFKNGIKVIGAKSDEIPTVAIQLTLNGGHKFDANDPSKSGLAQITAALLNESTENYSAEQMQEELRKIGSSINVSAGNSATTVTINTLKKNLKRTMELAAEKILRPGFVQADFDRNVKQQMEGIIASQKNPSAIASQVYNRLLYGDEHIYSVPASGIEGTVKNITLDDVKNFYQQYYSPNLGELVVVGDIEKREILSELDFLKNWDNKNVKVPELPDPQPGDKTKVYLVDKVDAPQSEIRIGYMTDMEYDATGDYFKVIFNELPPGWCIQ